jgi:hypothetical protein
MTDFCSANTERITDSNYNQSYSSTGKTSCLPNGGSGFSTSVNGVVNTATVDAHVVTLLSNANAVAPEVLLPTESRPAQQYATNSAALRQNILNEYCFYYKRYMYILNDILMIAATTNKNNLNSDYTTKKTNTELLNSKLNQILQILQSLNNSRVNSLKSYYNIDRGVNQLNSELDQTRNQLIKHSTILKNASMEKDIKGAMVDYTIEKNSSSRNLLAIYGFMNIVAVGLIFYLYRSVKN